MDFGAIVTKPGHDATTAAVKDQVFNSDAVSLKIWMASSVNISVSEWTGYEGTGIGDVDIAHNLGYAPFYLAFFKLKHASKLWFQDSLDNSVLFNNYIVGTAYSNDTYLHLHVSVNGDNLPAFTAIGYYIIFIDKAYQA